MDKVPLLSLQLSVGPYANFLSRIADMGACRVSSYVCVANVHMLVEAWRNPDYAEVVNQATLVTPDGMPLSIGLRWLYGMHQSRVAGMDLLPDLIATAAHRKLNVFFFGSTPTVLAQVVATCQTQFPSCSVVGSFSPPFRAMSSDEEDAIITLINASGANLVFVALGCPKQEKWMARMQGRVQAVMLGVGGALPVFAGLQNRAPDWMQRLSLEWLYRLYQEPGRLWKRYFLTNSIFVGIFLKEYIRLKWLGQSSAFRSS